MLDANRVMIGANNLFLAVPGWCWPAGTIRVDQADKFGIAPESGHAGV